MSARPAAPSLWHRWRHWISWCRGKQFESCIEAEIRAQVAFHFGLVALAACSTPIIGTKLSLLALAFVSSFYFNGLHETIHRTAFRSNMLNDAFAHIFGFLCLRPARHYFHYHWQHHRYTGNPKLDSELQPG